MARLLVNKGANPNLKNKLGKTALEIATDCEKREVRGYLDRKTSVKPERGKGFVKETSKNNNLDLNANSRLKSVLFQASTFGIFY